MAGLRVGQAYGGVPPTWVWVVGVSPQILGHPTSICDTGVKKANVKQRNWYTQIFNSIFIKKTHSTASLDPFMDTFRSGGSI